MNSYVQLRNSDALMIYALDGFELFRINNASYYFFVKHGDQSRWLHQSPTGNPVWESISITNCWDNMPAEELASYAKAWIKMTQS